MISEKRIIGTYEGKAKGPLFIAIGAMHGNEPAGVRAIELVLKMLEVEPVRNPDFTYIGQFLGLIGNVTAYEAGVRFMVKDMNRNFTASDHRHLDSSDCDVEDREIIELQTTIKNAIAAYRPNKVILLDLHTTSSYGGIFTICRDKAPDIEIASAMHAPIVLGMLSGLKGTTLHYFTTETLGVETTPITFESGQHTEELSVRRAVAGLINCMKAIGSVKEDDVENHHEQILIQYSADLPKLTRLVDRHGIKEQDEFRMNPGYKNFQRVKAGETVAQDKNGPVKIPQDGLILMPLYQDKGEDGYFLIEEVI